MNRRSMGWLGACFALLLVCGSFAACNSDDSNGGGGNSDGIDSGGITLTDGSTGGGSCTPNAKDCVSSTLARICPPDGSGWISYACGTGGTCTDGVCSVPPTSCSAAQNTCTDAKTALRCNANGLGFTSTACPANTACVGAGICQGACVVGAGTCGNGNTVAGVCADGNTITSSVCGTGQLCVTTSAPGAAVQTTACKAAACDPNQCPVCGNKINPAADQTKFTSVCVATPNGFAYQATSCVAGTCNPNDGEGDCRGQYAQCQSNCTPGATRCDSTSNGIQTCDSTGNWAAAVACNGSVTATPLQCESTGSGAVCGEAFCAQGGNATCDTTGKLRTCGPDGKLGAATACSSGACVANDGTTAGLPSNASCQTQCNAGDTQCTGPNATSYETCVNGLWSAPVECAGDAICRGYTTLVGRPSTLCGGICTPGTHQCEPVDGGAYNGAIQTCDATGQWSASAACTVGVCTNASGGGDYACQAECVPSTTTCTGNYVNNGTPFSGRVATAACTAQGLLPAYPNCEGITDGGLGCCQGDTVCRNGANGNATGCLECIGPSVPGGNENGQTDTKCVSTDELGDAGVETCGASNTWPAAPSTSCPSGTSCTTSSQVCGQCYGGDCTKSRLGQCYYYELQGPEQCGSTPDCCGNYCQTNYNQTAYCSSSPSVVPLP